MQLASADAPQNKLEALCFKFERKNKGAECSFRQPAETKRCELESPPQNQIEAQQSGFDLERKKEPRDMELSRIAEAECSWLLLTRWHSRRDSNARPSA